MIKYLYLRFMDLLFHILHLGIIFFSLFGWIFRETRLANLVLLILIAFSWLVLGFFFGFGYCLITDWHWKIKKRLGECPISGGYVKYIIDRATGMDISTVKADKLTYALFYSALAISMALNFIDHLKLQ